MPLPRRVTKLHDLEVDEISLVDRPANQHGMIAFSKRAEDDMPGLFDPQTGQPVDEADLQHGDEVMDETGEVHLVLEEDSPEYQQLVEGVESAYDDDYADDYADDGELAGVGKAFGGARRLLSGAKEGIPEDERLSLRARGGLGASRFARRTRARAGQAAESAGRRGRSATTAAGMQYRALPAGARSGVRYGAAGAGGAGVGYEGKKHFGKSLGDSVLEELSKAMTDADRDEVIAKAMDYIADVDNRNNELVDVVKSLIDEREDEQFSALAGQYHLPVQSTELGRVLKRAAQALPREDVDLLDRILTAAGEQTLYSEIGKAGPQASSDVLDQVLGLTEEVVVKSDLTREQAMTEVFAANTDAYDLYLAETGQLR